MSQSTTMNLRKRVLLGVGATLVGMIGLLLAFSMTIVKNGFEVVENRDAVQNVGRVRDAYAMQVENVEVKIIDWSMWDDAYKYMKDGNKAFEDSSLAIGALLGMKFELFVWRHNDGRIQWGRIFDLEKGEAKPLAPEMVAYFNANAKLFEYKDEEDRRKGLLDIPGLGPSFIAIQPIVTSEGKGPILGSLIAARAVNAAMIERLGKLTHLKLESRLPAEAAKAYAPAVAALKQDSDSFVEVASKDEITGYARFTDLLGQPVSFVKLSTPREIHAQGQSTIWAFIAALVVAGLGFGVVITLMLEKNVISRVLGLSSEIESIRSSSDVRGRVTSTGGDELTKLSDSMNGMLDSIERGQNEISARNRDMRLILDNAEQGFMNVDLSGRLVGEASTAIRNWLGTPEDGQSLWGYLFATDPKAAKLFEMGWAQLVEDIFPFEVSADQLPRRFVRDQSIFEVVLRPVTGENGALFRVLAVVSDITAQVQAEIKERQQKELVRVFQMMSVDKAALLEFFDDSAKSVSTLVASPAMAKDLQFRMVHTLKGNAAQYGLESFAKVCHELESKLVDLGDSLVPTDLVALRTAWADSEERFAKLIGRGQRDQSIALPVQEHAALIAELASIPGARHVATRVESYALEPVANRLERLSEMASSLAERLGKGSIQVGIEHGGLRVDPKPFAEYWSAMVHVVRNAVDHGLESPDESTGKAPRLDLRAFRDETGRFCVEVRDHGRGVNWEAVREKAAARGLAAGSQEDLVEALFADGLSTKDAITEVSGRGVGMAAVRSTVESLGGRIEVRSKSGEGTSFRFLFPATVGRIYEPGAERRELRRAA